MTIKPQADDFALTCKPEELAIATPRPSKLKEAKGFESIWNLACEALDTADAIVFIGFRFPETDAYARERLLEAIGKNSGPLMLHVNVVLGRPGPDTDRLSALLHLAGRRRQRPTNVVAVPPVHVPVHPLYGQDFLAMFRRDDL